MLRVSGRVGTCRTLCLKNSRALEVRCRRVDVEMFASRALEACCTCSDVAEAQRFGALEMRYRRVDVEVFASRALEVRCRRVDVEMFCLKRSGGWGPCCGCRDV